MQRQVLLVAKTSMVSCFQGLVYSDDHDDDCCLLASVVPARQHHVLAASQAQLKRVTMLIRICLARPVHAAGTPASKSAGADLTMVNCHTPCMRDIVPSLITMILVVMMIVVVFSSAALAASS